MDGSQQQERQPRRRAEPEPMDDDDDYVPSDESSMEEGETDVMDRLRIKRYQVVGARPQFQVVRKTTIREEGPRLPALFRVEYRGGRIIEGTLAFINRDLGDRIAAITDGLIRDQTINWEPVLQKIRLQMQQQQQQQNGH